MPSEEVVTADATDEVDEVSVDSAEDSMEPLRTQAGFEFESPGTRWEALTGWYTATDVSSWEERLIHWMQLEGAPAATAAS